MGMVVLGMSISLDGFINDRNGSVGRLYPDLAALRETESLKRAIRDAGAVGRIRLEQVEVLDSPQRTHLRFRVSTLQDAVEPPRRAAGQPELER